MSYSSECRSCTTAAQGAEDTSPVLDPLGENVVPERLAHHADKAGPNADMTSLVQGISGEERGGGGREEGRSEGAEEEEMIVDDITVPLHGGTALPVAERLASFLTSLHKGEWCDVRIRSTQ